MAEPRVPDLAGTDAQHGGAAPDDEVRLELPALEGYGRVARVAAAALALRANLGFSLVEDARLAMEAVTERCLPLAHHDRLVLRFRIGAGRLDVVLSEADLSERTAGELTTALTPLVHDVFVDAAAGTVAFGLRRRPQ